MIFSFYTYDYHYDNLLLHTIWDDSYLMYVMQKDEIQSKACRMRWYELKLSTYGCLDADVTDYRRTHQPSQNHLL